MGSGIEGLCFLAVHPFVPSTLYAVGCSLNGFGGNGGFFTSTDSGNTWTASPTTAFHTPGAYVVDSVNPANMYIGDYNFGAFKSTNGGVTWVAANGGFPTGTRVYALAMDSTNTFVLYAGTSQGMFKTTNAAANWVPMNTGLPAGNYISGLAIDPASQGTLYDLRLCASRRRV